VKCIIQLSFRAVTLKCYVYVSGSCGVPAVQPLNGGWWHRHMPDPLQSCQS